MRDGWLLGMRTAFSRRTRVRFGDFEMRWEAGGLPSLFSCSDSDVQETVRRR